VEKLDAKKAKEAAKNAAKKNKRVVRGAAKDANYFVEGTASAAQIDGTLNDVDVVIARIDNEELADLTAKLSAAKGAAEVKAAFKAEVDRLKGAGKAKDGELKNLE
jgi:DnaJ family protein C protein 2